MTTEPSDLLTTIYPSLDEITLTQLYCNYSSVNDDYAVNGSQLFCTVNWDGVSCWPSTLAGSTATVSCFSELNGVKYDTSIRSNSWDAQLAGPNDPRYARLETNLCIGQAKVSCQVIYSQFGLAIHQNDHQARRRFVEWAQNEIAVVPDFHKRILFSDEAHFWLNGYVNKQNCRIWSEANPQVYVETPLHPEKLTVWCALWAGGILLQKR
ncbi:g_PROTEIN_RECEP_F2_3 domain-containing protein [Trichonephila clavipes]|nr:g_PROTEIN_RECEP_F2_3 domain-containing protein [Trichonephila clavipes]